MIPRTIHAVWMGGPMPPEYRQHLDQWKALNPGWRVRLWGNQEIDAATWRNQNLIDRAPELCPERFIPRFRSNLIRYEILERHGGVYVDCDLKPLQPLPDLTGIEVMAGWERQGEWIGNSIIGAIPGHPLITALVDGAAASCEKYGPERSPVTTGPQYLTRTWRAVQPLPEGVRLYDEPVFYPRSWRDLDKPPAPLPPEAITDHLWAALRGSVSVVIPYRPDGAERDRNLTWVLDRLSTEHPDWQIIVQEEGPGEREGLFNRARLIRDGVAKSFGDILVIHDGDVWCPGLVDAVEKVRGGAKWALPHTKVHRLTPEATEAIIAGHVALHPELECDEKPYTGCVTGGAVVITRDLFHQIPPDPRFCGWGGEDLSWGKALQTLVPGAVWGSPEQLYHLWHPPQPRLTRAIGNEANAELQARYLNATGHPERMAQLVAEIDGAPPETLPPAAGKHRRWRNTITGQQRTVRAGSRADWRLHRNPLWAET